MHSGEDAFKATVERAVAKYIRLFLLSRSAWSHEEQAREKIEEQVRKAGGQPSDKTGFPEQLADVRKKDRLVFMQGCGDLTMNLWNVAFVSGDSCYREDSLGNCYTRQMSR